ncbi:hypothetical protein J2X47_001065 [Sphingomonas sp. BE270]|jgi:hypothetical protein|uniref:hypothetical protein n=1 Tax=unclassified Sphingomonas TaxID=196159 RepID=UPI0010F7622B|nr:MULTISPECIES: hypothetical protein [unclassified Sphingomonas]MDR6847357.1 hypothetical protein [Sphingomonas sp. BE137]MDR7256901.1 hypothetical protein [Sphingomonas sp. BE270]
MLGLAWKSLGWFLAGVAVALGFLLVPLQVAAERKKLDRTASEIERARRDIRALETEFDTRANLAQLDKWNAETLGLVAPAEGQFVQDEAALASIEPGSAPAPGTPAVQMASFVPAAPVTAMTSQRSPAPQPATAVAPASRDERAVIQRAVPPPRAAMAAAAPPRPRAAVAMLDRALLDDSMIGDLRSGARAESRSAR